MCIQHSWSELTQSIAAQIKLPFNDDMVRPFNKITVVIFSWRSRDLTVSNRSLDCQKIIDVSRPLPQLFCEIIGQVAKHNFTRDTVNTKQCNAKI